MFQMRVAGWGWVQGGRVVRLAGPERPVCPARGLGLDPGVVVVVQPVGRCPAEADLLPALTDAVAGRGGVKGVVEAGACKLGVAGAFLFNFWCFLNVLSAPGCVLSGIAGLYLCLRSPQAPLPSSLVSW